jgi:hypothetical protein
MLGLCGLPMGPIGELFSFLCLFSLWERGKGFGAVKTGQARELLAAVEFIGHIANSRSAHRHQVGRDQLKLAEGVKERK